jgi:uncharacterized protein YbaA (DUF1428 family)
MMNYTFLLLGLYKLRQNILGHELAGSRPLYLSSAKKNHDLTVQLCKEFGDIIRNYGVGHLVFELSNTEAPMEGITNIAKAVSATQDEEVWLELIFYRDRKHKDEVAAKMRMGTLWQLSIELVTPGTGFIMGEFSRLIETAKKFYKNKLALMEVGLNSVYCGWNTKARKYDHQSRLFWWSWTST